MVGLSSTRFIYIKQHLKLHLQNIKLCHVTALVMQYKMACDKCHKLIRRVKKTMKRIRSRF